MWLGEKSGRVLPEDKGLGVAVVSNGGSRPRAVLNGQAQSVSLPGAGTIYFPKAGDQLLIAQSDDGECFALLSCQGEAPPDGEKGEVRLLCPEGGSIRLTPDGKIRLCGSIILEGDTSISGELTINGVVYGQNDAQGGQSGGAEA